MEALKLLILSIYKVTKILSGRSVTGKKLMVDEPVILIDPARVPLPTLISSAEDAMPTIPLLVNTPFILTLP